MTLGYVDRMAAEWATRDRRLIRLVAARALGTHRPAEWEKLRADYGHCVRCGDVPDDIRRLSPDHIVPLSLGGCDSIHNLQPLCRECNTSKGRECVDYRAPQSYGPPHPAPPCGDRCPCAAIRRAFQ